MKEKISIKRKVLEEGGMCLTNDYNKRSEDRLYINNEKDITEELKSKFKYLIVLTSIIPKAESHDIDDITYLFRIVLDIHTNEIVFQECITTTAVENMVIGIANPAINIDDKHFESTIIDPHKLLDLDDYLIFEFDCGLQIKYNVDYDEEDVVINNTELIKDIHNVLYVTNNIESEAGLVGDRKITSKEIASGEVLKIVSEYKYYICETQILTSTNLLYGFAVKIERKVNNTTPVAMYAYCKNLTLNTIKDLTVHLDEGENSNKELHFYDPNGVFSTEDKITIDISDEENAKFTLVENYKKNDDIKSFVRKFM